MLQKVNLYLDGFETPKIILPSAQMAAAIVGFLVLLVLPIALLGSGGLKAKIAQLEQSKVSLETEVASLKTQLDERKVDPALKSKLDSLQRSVQARQQVIAMLGAGDKANMTGFSPYLRGLSQQPVAGVWLTDIELYEGGSNVAFSGVTVKPENLPSFLKQIGEEDAFRGREFEKLDIQRETGDESSKRLRFEIRSRLESGRK